MMNWLPTSPLLNRPPSLPDPRDLLAELDGWSIAELMRNERFAPMPDQALPPMSSMGARAEPVTAAPQPGWLADAQWQPTPDTMPWPEPPPTPRSAVSEDPFERAALRMRRSVISDARRRPPMGPPFLNEQPQDYPSHMGPVPQAPDWEQAVTSPSPLSPFAKPPRATDWGRTVAAIDETAEAEDARHAAAMRIGQWRRRNQWPYEGYTAPLPAPPADDSDLGERARLNLLDSYYRGSLFGAGRLALMKMLNELPDDGVSPATRRTRDELRKEYQQILADLDRYDRMQGYQNPSEFGAAALGQLGGMAFNGVVANPLAVRLGQMARYGHEMHIGGMRIAPFGNRRGHPTGRWPHYHRGRPDPSRPGDSLHNQGGGRHRPWEGRESDTSIFDRF